MSRYPVPAYIVNKVRGFDNAATSFLLIQSRNVQTTSAVSCHVRDHCEHFAVSDEKPDIAVTWEALL